MNNLEIKASKFMSLVLRHKPNIANLTLDKNGWASISDLLSAMKKKGFDINRDGLESIVKNCNKKRYAISDDGTKIRAVQGHSVTVDAMLKKANPPAFLYHGTPAKNKDSILRTGLNKGNRHHVHLSGDLETAKQVGARRRTDYVVFRIQTEAMLKDNIIFFISENGVWFVDFVDPKYLSIQEEL